MKKAMLIIAITAASSFGSAAFADQNNAGTCYVISNPDARAYCRAKEHKEPAACYIIQRADLRTQCMIDAKR